MRAHMLDKCPLDGYAAVSRTVEEDLGAPPVNSCSDVH